MSTPIRSTPGETSAARRRLLVGAAAAAPLLATSHGAAAAAAQDASKYPNHPIRLIVPYTAGSIGDLFIRPVGQALGERLGQAIIIDNRPGASQAIGAEMAARSDPDGYTLFMGTQSAFVLNRAARKSLPYDPDKDFAPITMLFTAPMYVYVRTGLPAKNIQELIALAKSKPGALTFASIGPGTSSHLAGEMFKTMADVDMLHVPYKGGPQATNALMAGEVDIVFNGGNTLAQVNQGKARVLGIGAARRASNLPELRTLEEQGLKGYDVSPWFALFAPAGTPRPIIDKINVAMNPLLKEPETIKRAAAQGLEVYSSTPEELGTTLKNDYPIWEKIMRKAGIDRE